MVKIYLYMLNIIKILFDLFKEDMILLKVLALFDGFTSLFIFLKINYSLKKFLLII